MRSYIQSLTFGKKNLFKSIFIQAVIVIVVFNFVSFLRETPMLSSGEKLPENLVSVTTVTGEEIELKKVHKKKILYFFAPWCQVCHASISNLQKVYIENNDIDVYAIALDYREVKEIKQFTNKHQLTFPVLLGNQELKKSFKIQGYPSYYIINEDNFVVAKSFGYSTEIGLILRSL